MWQAHRQVPEHGNRQAWTLLESGPGFRNLGAADSLSQILLCRGGLSCAP